MERDQQKIWAAVEDKVDAIGKNIDKKTEAEVVADVENFRDALWDTFLLQIVDLNENLVSDVLRGDSGGHDADASTRTKTLIDACKYLRIALKGSSIADAALCGYIFGIAEQEFNFALNGGVKSNRHAQKILRALCDARAHKLNATQKRRNKIIAAVKARLKDHPHDSLTYARSIVADQMGIHQKTVRTATLGMKKPRKKIKK